MAKIALLGCGWLGLPSAKSLLTYGHTVKGSTTTERKLETLTAAGIIPSLIALHANSETGDITAFLKGQEILIIDIPPKLRGDAKENFTAKIRMLIPFIEKSGIQKVLFVSSTSVYADDNSVVTEDTVALPYTEAGRQLLESEQLLQSSEMFQTTVVRFGGLIGEDRHPVHYLAGRENLENPQGPVNLIHLDDCIGVIEAIIERNLWGETFNAAAPNHPTRKEYYTAKATAFGLQQPLFAATPSKGKTISAEKVIQKLDYVFKQTI